MFLFPLPARRFPVWVEGTFSFSLLRMVKLVAGTFLGTHRGSKGFVRAGMLRAGWVDSECKVLWWGFAVKLERKWWEWKLCREASEKKKLSIIETSGKEIPQNLESCYQSRGGREVVVIVLLSWVAWVIFRWGWDSGASTIYLSSVSGNTWYFWCP